MKKLISGIFAMTILVVGANCDVVKVANEDLIKSTNKCIACHGKLYEKSALNKSKIVSEMEVEDIKTALVGYKNGTYGGPMKGLMAAQVKNYTEEELELVANYIKSLK